MPGNRGAERKYKCMTVAELAEYQLPPLAPDCLMLMWRCAAMQQEALAVVKHWGFTVKSEIVWNKLTKHGKLWFGQGHYVRGSHEVCLVCVRGRVKVRDRSIRSSFSAYAGGPEHSRKPDEIYTIAERLSAGPYCELFATRMRAGWRQSGLSLKP